MRRRLFMVVAMIWCGTVTPSDLPAQICLGRLRLDVARLNAGVRVDQRKRGTGLGASLSGGADRAFGGVALSRLHYSEFDAQASALSAYVGWSVVPAIETLFICPLVQGSYGRGPNTVTGATQTTRTSWSGLVGLAVAGQIALTSSMSLIPNVTGGIVVQQSKETGTTSGRSGSDLGGTIGAGIAVLLRDRWAIQPAARVPVGFTDRTPAYSLGVTIGLRTESR